MPQPAPPCSRHRFDAEATVDWLGQLSSNVSRSDLGNLGSNLGDLGSELGSELGSGGRLDSGALGADAGGGGELLGRALSDERIYYQLGAVLSTVATVAVLLLICFWGRCGRGLGLGLALTLARALTSATESS